MRKLALAAALLPVLTAPAFAADTFEFDKSHTEIVWKVNHLGFSTSIGEFDEFDGTLILDQDNPENSKLDVTIQIGSIDSGVPALDDHLKKDDFFDAANHPTATFKSTKVDVTGENTAKVTGDLTIRGTTKPVTLDVTLNGLGAHPFQDGVTVAGFSARTVIDRTEFGVSAYAPAVGAEVELVIESEAQKK